jgi:hypothetical protein
LSSSHILISTHKHRDTDERSILATSKKDEEEEEIPDNQDFVLNQDS